jgi:transcriptional regulator with XRE-family HTH domain
MNAQLAKNIRNIRDAKHWTQHHLAEVAGIQLRTVQRVEAGDGASVDTLGALASAFDVTIDVLQFDFEALEAHIKTQNDALTKTHDVIPVTPVNSSADLNVVGDHHAYIFECVPNDDAVQDVFAALASELRDMGDIWDDVEALHHRDWVKSAFVRVEELRQLGVVVCTGSANRTIKMATGSVHLKVLCVVAWPKDEVKEAIAVPKA